MIITATIDNSQQKNDITVETDGKPKTIAIPSKPNGQGSSVNGGELLFLALATCYCNDVYREAARRNLEIQSVQVSVSGQFGKEGEPGSGITYTVHIQSGDSSGKIAELIAYVDKIAEIHNTLRQGASVHLIHQA